MPWVDRVLWDGSGGTDRAVCCANRAQVLDLPPLVNLYPDSLRALCIGRHPYLSEHYARFFAALGLHTTAVVGVEAAVEAASRVKPAIVLCDYDLFATRSIEAWEKHPILGAVPTIAISLTRRPREMNVLDVNGIAGSLYLPTLSREDALRLLGAACPPDFRLSSPFLDQGRSPSWLSQ